ncbi:hypothetical protein ACQ4M3_13425 [Leptolyngbya sp. AN03gr2]|uniref:hypothetical protein n=1 Tax=unclassified Leptolyngbya TaxID=2650499 RepID=UPI003D31ED0C
MTTQLMETLQTEASEQVSEAYVKFQSFVREQYDTNEIFRLFCLLSMLVVLFSGTVIVRIAKIIWRWLQQGYTWAKPQVIATWNKMLADRSAEQLLQALLAQCQNRGSRIAPHVQAMIQRFNQSIKNSIQQIKAKIRSTDSNTVK